MKKALKVSLAVVVFILMAMVQAYALGPKIETRYAVWDQNAEADLAGYYLYWRVQGGQFSDTNRVVVLKTATAGGKPAPSFDLMSLNLSSGMYDIAVAAFDTASNESGLSNIVPFDGSYPANPLNLKNTK